MKRIKLVLAGIVVSGILAGCTEEAAPQPAEKVKDEQALPASNDAKEWKDASTPEGFNKYGIEPTLQAWIAYHAEDVRNTTNANEYLQKATNIAEESSKYFRVQGEDLQTDFNNLRMLGTTINHFTYLRSEQEKQGIGTAETIEELNKAMTYFTELLHDLDIVMNHDGKGELFGVTHQLDGQKVEELEAFIY